MPLSNVRPRLLVCLMCALSVAALAANPRKEYLTAKEIEKIQDNQEIDKRVRIYLDAAALRLKTAEDRLNGKEAEPGDALEFFSVPEMLDGYFQIIRSVMLNLDSASQNPGVDKGKVEKALHSLKDSTERSSKDLAALKKIAEDKKLEEVWNLVNQAIDITRAAHEGSTDALARTPPPKRK